MSVDVLRKAFGSPIYDDAEIQLFVGDSIELLSKLDDFEFNLTVTSPPYNIGKEYENILPLEEYLSWCEKWISLIYSLTSPNGAFWLNLGYFSIEKRAKAIPIPYLLWDRIPFFMIQEIVWNYGAGVAAKNYFSPRNEKFLWYVKNSEDYVFNLDAVRDPNVKYPNQKKNGKLRCNTIGKNPSDVWQIAKVTSGKNRSSLERTSHPAQFPLDVVTRIIRASSQPNDLILDPFSGSGSTLMAAMQEGRRAVGIEINPEYAEMAARRLHLARKAIASNESQAEMFSSKTFQRKQFEPSDIS